MKASSWKLYIKLGGFGAFTGVSSTLAYMYSSDNKSLKNLKLFPDNQKSESYWNSFGKNTLHQGIRKWDEQWDSSTAQKKEESKSDKKPRVSRNLILIRHGHYNLDGESDKEKFLTDLGIKQAEYTAKRLLELKIPVTSITSSTKLRAQETAHVLKERLPHDVQVCDDDPDLNEGRPYPVEPYSSKLGKKFLNESTYQQEGTRIERAFKRHFHRPIAEQEADSFELIVCHANVIRYFLLRALQLPPEAWIRISLKHSSITWIQITSDGYCILQAVGEASHIPPELLSSSKNVIKYKK